MKVRIKNPIYGVPITFLYSYNPKQFEIVDPRDFTDVERLKLKNTMLIKDKDSAINGKPTYARIAIKKKNENNTNENISFKILGITRS